MKTCTIQNWQVGSNLPNKTKVTAAVAEDIGGVHKLTHYNLVIDKRFDSMCPEFQAAVEEKLTVAGVL